VDAPSQAWSLTARWLFPVAAPPLANGVLTVAGSRILAVEPAGARTPDLDLGDAAVLPGLVNAHTHLDLSGLRGAVPFNGSFTDWLRAVIRHRRARAEVEADVRAGLAECVRAGTTLLGDISAGGASWDALAPSGIRAVVFHELLGLPRERADAALAAAEQWLNDHPATPTCRPGLSPHAPYSVRADVVGRSSALAEPHGAALAIHLAETADELELLRHRRGPFVPFLQELGVWAPDGLARSFAQVMRAGSWKERIPRLFIHGNYLRPDAAVKPNASIVYCPRTHAYFGHPPHPFREFLRRGRRVALGTDSLSSNPDLDLLAEARFLRRLHPDLPGAALLRMATLAGAEALGWADQTGSLEPGKSADLAVVPLANGDNGDPHDLVLGGDRPVSRVMCRGRWLAP
jgi:cytosine/adenosine deaminase-related metal-dependent hydrolase